MRGLFPGPVLPRSGAAPRCSTPVPYGPPGDPMSVHWPILRNLLMNPRRVFAIDDLRRYRGIDLLVGAMHLAGEIDRRCSSWTVGVMLPTGGAFPMAVLAGWMLGKTVVPLNYLLKPEELQFVLADCGP